MFVYSEFHISNPHEALFCIYLSLIIHFVLC